MPFDVAAELAGAPEDCQRFFDELFRPREWGAAPLAWDLAVSYRTLDSRFARAGLLSPKHHAAVAAFVLAAEHFAAGENSDEVAYALGLSSRNAMGRALRNYVGVTITEFREHYTPLVMVERFRAQLVTPYRATLLEFHPLRVGIVGR